MNYENGIMCVSGSAAFKDFVETAVKEDDVASWPGSAD